MRVIVRWRDLDEITRWGGLSRGSGGGGTYEVGKALNSIGNLVLYDADLEWRL